MMSKNSFWANMRENLKRRNWIMVIYSVIFLLAFPVGLTLWISSHEYYKETETLAKWKEEMIIGLSEYLSVNIMVTLLVTILAVVCAVQGFSYLFRRQKMDMYMSVPVSKERRFAVIYLNGILLFAVPYLISLMISLCISAGNGILTAEVVKSMLYSCLTYIVYYTAVYNITIIAVMLTGNMLVSLCAAGVFLFYEIIAKLIFQTLCTAFFHTYSYLSADFKMWCSPVIMMIESSRFVENDIVTVPWLIQQTGVTIVKIFVIAIVAGIIGYLLYAYRPSESCNRAIAFGKTKPVIKVAVMVPISIVAGVLFFSITNGNIAMTIFGFIIGTILSHCMMEIIFAFDLKAVLKHPVSGVVGAVLVFGIFAVFHFDVTGYDRWVPNPKRVESIALDIPAMSNDGYYDFENSTWIDSTGYSLEKMELTDTETICVLMKEVMAEQQQQEEEEETAEGQRMLWMNVKYRLKNGEEKYRSVRLPVDKYLDKLNTIVVSEEYQRGAYPILNEDINGKIKIKSIDFSNGVWNKTIDTKEIEQVYENYIADLAQYDLETVVNEYPIGILYINVESLNADVMYDRTQTYTMPIYASFEKTKAYGDERGYLKDWKEKIDDIKVITISHWNEDTYESIDKNFEAREEIEELLPAIIPGEIANYRYCIEEPDYSYDAYVSFQDENGTDWNDYGSYFYVYSSLLPDFAK